MRMIGYCRVSTEGQAAEGVSLDAQRQRIAAWCAARGDALDPADLFVDAGISGKRSDNRPGLLAAIDAACGSHGVMVVYSLSRLARSVKDTFTIAEQLDKAGADLVSLTESIDTTTAAGRMFFGMMAVLAAFERDLISERTRSALDHKRARGERIGQVPYGCRLAPDGRTLVADAGEQGIMAEICGLGAGGLTTRAIARVMTHRGVPTKNGGPAWSHKSVARIITRGADHAQA